MEVLGLLWACFRLLSPPLLGMFSAALVDCGILFQLLRLVSVCFRLIVPDQAFSQLCQETRESKSLPRTMPRTMPRTKSVQTPTRKIKSQSLVLLNSFPYRKPPYSKNLGGGTPPRGASIRRPTGDGVLDKATRSSCPSNSSSWDQAPCPALLLPLLNPPHWLRVDSILCGHLRRWRLLAPLVPKKSPSKRPSKTNQILMPFQHRFLTVLAPFWRAKMAPKSIKNR